MALMNFAGGITNGDLKFGTANLDADEVGLHGGIEPHEGRARQVKTITATKLIWEFDESIATTPIRETKTARRLLPARRR
jgi:hypothetical protein